MEKKITITIDGNVYDVKPGVADDIKNLVASYEPIVEEAVVAPNAEKFDLAYKNLSLIREKLLEAKIKKGKISLSEEVKEGMTASINQIMAVILPATGDSQ